MYYIYLKKGEDDVQTPPTAAPRRLRTFGSDPTATPGAVEASSGANVAVEPGSPSLRNEVDSYVARLSTMNAA